MKNAIQITIAMLLGLSLATNGWLGLYVYKTADKQVVVPVQITERLK